MMGVFEQLGLEPSLDDVLEDPIVRLVMQRDGVIQDDLDGLIERARAGLRRVAIAAAPSGAAEAA